MSPLFGNLLIIFANIAWVFYIVITKKELSHKVDILLMTTYMFFIGFHYNSSDCFIQTKGFLIFC